MEVEKQEAVNLQRVAEARSASDNQFKKEAEEKLAMITEAHDIEREMYVDRIRDLQAEIGAKQNVTDMGMKLEVDMVICSE